MHRDRYSAAATGVGWLAVRRYHNPLNQTPQRLACTLSQLLLPLLTLTRRLSSTRCAAAMLIDAPIQEHGGSPRHRVIGAAHVAPQRVNSPAIALHSMGMQLNLLLRHRRQRRLNLVLPAFCNPHPGDNRPHVSRAVFDRSQLRGQLPVEVLQFALKRPTLPVLGFPELCHLLTRSRQRRLDDFWRQQPIANRLNHARLYVRHRNHACIRARTGLGLYALGTPVPNDMDGAAASAP
nr:hypothetical protein [Hyphomicrobium sulfonivorans]